jgi:ketosteroid isomerase-like protein
LCAAPGNSRCSVFRRFETAWEKLEVAAEEFIDAGEHVFVAVHFWGTGRASGIPVDACLYEVYTLRDRRIIRVDEFTDRKAAIDAVGLRE